MKTGQLILRARNDAQGGMVRLYLCGPGEELEVASLRGAFATPETVGALADLVLASMGPVLAEGGLEVVAVTPGVELN
jgi:hypothetical protein